MRLLISGSHGLVGTGLVPRLRDAGHEVFPLLRNQAKADEIHWEPATGVIHFPPAIKGFDAVIHLAGENIANRRWSNSQKLKIQESRIEVTKRLSSTLITLSSPPSIFIAASAIGFYGNRGDEILTEKKAAGTGFLSEVVRSWEGASEILASIGTRVVHLRFGVILSRQGGVLARLLPLFKAGLGGNVGSGSQWMSWIHLEDALRIISYSLENTQLSGVLNAVSPNPVRNEKFTKTLAEILRRPAILNVPAFALKLALGEMAEELLLASQRVLPDRLLKDGFSFKFSGLESALNEELTKKRH
jgi:uncharacterized protein (TIGR01777 family)